LEKKNNNNNYNNLNRYLSIKEERKYDEEYFV